MIGVIVVGNVVYYVQNEKLIGYATIREIGDRTQTTVMVEVAK